jgi:hypothetical protein
MGDSKVGAGEGYEPVIRPNLYGGSWGRSFQVGNQRLDYRESENEQDARDPHIGKTLRTDKVVRFLLGDASCTAPWAVPTLRCRQSHFKDWDPARQGNR